MSADEILGFSAVHFIKFNSSLLPDTRKILPRLPGIFRIDQATHLVHINEKVPLILLPQNESYLYIPLLILDTVFSVCLTLCLSSFEKYCIWEICPCNNPNLEYLNGMILHSKKRTIEWMRRFLVHGATKWSPCFCSLFTSWKCEYTG